MLFRNSRMSSQMKKSLSTLTAAAILAGSLSIGASRADALILARSDEDFRVGLIFLIFFFPIGLILDGSNPGDLDWNKNLYLHLPFLKGTLEGKEIESAIMERLKAVQAEVSKLEQSARDQKIKEIISNSTDLSFDAEKKHFGIKFEEEWIRDLLEGDEYTDAEIDLAVTTLANF